MRELRNVLLREKFRRYATAWEVAEFVAGLREKGVMAEEGTVEPVSRDPKDDYLLALARASGADFLISGDQHLHALEGQGLPRAITPRDFVDFLEYESR